jgi:hypothetical protein
MSVPVEERSVDTNTNTVEDAEIITLTVTVGGSGSSRNAVGLTGDRLVAGQGVRNFLQALVVEKGTGYLYGYDESDDGNVHLGSLPTGKTYELLLLLGHWVNNNTPPTLLNAGMSEFTLNSTEEVIVSVQLLPIIVDTRIVGTGYTNTGKIFQPRRIDGIPQKIYMHLGPDAFYNIEWTLLNKQGKNGLAALFQAQKTLGDDPITLTPEAGVVKVCSEYLNSNDLSLPVAKKIAKLERFPDPSVAFSSGDGLNATTNKITQSFNTQYLGSYKAYFNLEYVPFNLTESNRWQIFHTDARVTSTHFDLTNSKVPTWIIRNGVNDELPTANTNFALYTAAAPTYNANGAIVIVVSNDSDTDGMPDAWEEEHDSRSPSDGNNDGNLDPTGDEDGDGLSNKDEYDNGTDPKVADTDGDGYPDGYEVENVTDPLDPADHPNPANPDDYDNDGLENDDEASAGTNPYIADTDGDGLSDGEEVHGVEGVTSNPLVSDTDNDGLSDYVEVKGWTNGGGTFTSNPTASDTDSDKFSDKWEYDHFTNPKDFTSPAGSDDSDGDGWSNNAERNNTPNATDPSDGASFPSAFSGSIDVGIIEE